MPPESAMPRNRITYLCLWLTTVLLGLSTRNCPQFWSPLVRTYGGDTLWATMVVMGGGALFPCWGARRLAIASLSLAYAVEVSQLYHAPWLDAVRHTHLGGLLLGYTFLWSDLACYTIGVCLGALVDLSLTRRTPPTTSHDC